MHQKDIGNRIASIRKSKGLTQDELALKAKLNIRTIQRIENSEVNARPYTLRLIANALEMDQNEFNEMETLAKTDQSKIWIVALHLSCIMPIVIIPIIIWALKKDEYPEIIPHVKETINFQISMSIYLFAAAMLVFVAIGVIILPILGIFCFFISILNAVKFMMDQQYRYPFTIEFLK